MSSPAPPQYSPDGKWWWDGTQWVPAPTPSYGSQGYGTAQPYGPPYHSEDSSDTKGIISVIVGVLWLGGVGSIAAVVLAHMSRSQAKKEQRDPSGVSMAGLVIGYLGIAATALGILALVTVGFTFKDEIVSAVHVDQELLSAGDAEQTYHDANGRYTASLEELRSYGYEPGAKVEISVLSASATSFCLKSTFFNRPFYYSNTDDAPTTKPCS